MDPGEMVRRQQEQQRQRDHQARLRQQEQQRQQQQAQRDQQWFKQHMDRGRQARRARVTPTPGTCTSCGFQNGADSQFCTGCGADLAPRTEPSTSEISSRPRRGRVVVLLFVLLAVVAAGAALWYVEDAQADGTPATATEFLNVREGPSVQHPVVGELAPQQEVVIACVTGSWARLSEPFGGNYASMLYLTPATAPQAC
jgi:hypothetical protein